MLSVEYLRAGERLVVDRSMFDDGDDSVSPSGARSQSWALARMTADGRCLVELPPSALFAIESAEAVEDRSSPESDTAACASTYERAPREGEAFELPEGVRVRCSCGARTLTLRVVRDERSALPWTGDAAWSLSLVASIAMAVGVLVNLSVNARAFESELLERPRDGETALLHALIDRSLQQTNSEGREFRKISDKGAMARPIRFSLFCLCAVRGPRVDTYGLPTPSIESPFGDGAPFTRGIHALMSAQQALSESSDEEIAFGGLSDVSFGAPLSSGWSTWSPTGVLEWGAGTTPSSAAGEGRRRRRCRDGERWRGERRGCERVRRER